jgi:hypothetical protein
MELLLDKLIEGLIQQCDAVNAEGNAAMVFATMLYHLHCDMGFATTCRHLKDARVVLSQAGVYLLDCTGLVVS